MANLSFLGKMAKLPSAECTQHVVLSCSTFLPNIIKIFHRIFVLQNGQEINEEDDSYKLLAFYQILYHITLCNVYM